MQSVTCLLLSNKIKNKIIRNKKKKFKLEIINKIPKKFYYSILSLSLTFKAWTAVLLLSLQVQVSHNNKYVIVILLILLF